eukprot:264852_1
MNKLAYEYYRKHQIAYFQSQYENETIRQINIRMKRAWIQMGDMYKQYYYDLANQNSHLVNKKKRRKRANKNRNTNNNSNCIVNKTINLEPPTKKQKRENQQWDTHTLSTNDKQIPTTDAKISDTNQTTAEKLSNINANMEQSDRESSLDVERLLKVPSPSPNIFITTPSSQTSNEPHTKTDSTSNKKNSSTTATNETNQKQNKPIYDVYPQELVSANKQRKVQLMKDWKENKDLWFYVQKATNFTIDIFGVIVDYAFSCGYGFEI